jgi:hypothetical protein
MLWIVQQEQQIHISQQIKSYPEKKGNPIAHPMILIYRCIHGVKDVATQERRLTIVNGSE